jgi:transforming growth factor-beta-induced protein
MRKFVVSLLVVALAIVSVVPAFAQSDKTIVDIAVEDGRFTTLVAAAQAAGLVEALSGEGPFTVFAPTDDAFAAAFAALGIEPAALLADTATLTDILLYHVAAGKAMAADVVGLERVTTLNGLDIRIAVTDAGVFLNDSVQVIITDIEASNGVIHVIDSVLLPPFSVTNNRPNALNFRAGPGLNEPIIGTFPMEARAEAVARNEAGTWAQISLNGELGWVYAPLTTLSGDLMSLPVAMPNIVEIAVTDGRFTTLVAAVQAAGLAETLAGEGPFTVFAPTDDAFAAAFAALGIEPAALLEDTATLTNILLYHVVSGNVLAADVVGLSSATTVQGSDIRISVMDGKVYLNDTIQVIVTDVMADNGVIHVIDGVLLPPAE